MIKGLNPYCKYQKQYEFSPFLSQSRRLPLLQVVSNNKSFSVGVQSPTEINAPRGCAVILRRICQLSLTRITHQVSRAFDLNNSALFFITIKTPVPLFCKNHSCYEDIPFRNQKFKRIFNVIFCQKNTHHACYTWCASCNSMEYSVLQPNESAQHKRSSICMDFYLMNFTSG